MAALMKLCHTPVMQRCAWNHFNKMSRSISTSNNKKNSNTATTANTCADQNPPPCEKVPEKNWVSYGFDYTSHQEDTNVHHASFFFGVTLCLVFGGFAWAYAPDVHMRDWAQREAFLELRRRERLGLKPIDPNYVCPKTMKLPAESELNDVEIII